jgi:hypothetical protein
MKKKKKLAWEPLDRIVHITALVRPDEYDLPIPIDLALPRVMGLDEALDDFKRLFPLDHKLYAYRVENAETESDFYHIEGLDNLQIDVAYSEIDAYRPLARMAPMANCPRRKTS